MASSVSSISSFILILLSLLFFILPAIVGSSSILILFFLFSFGLLIVAFFTSMLGLSHTSKEGLSGLALSSLIISIAFLLFLVMGAFLQV